MAKDKKTKFELDTTATFNSLFGIDEHHGDGEVPLLEESVENDKVEYAHNHTDTDAHTDTENRVSKKPRKIISANYIEGRTKRANITLKPSVWEAAQKKCAKLNISVSDCVNQFLEEWIKEAD